MFKRMLLASDLSRSSRPAFKLALLKSATRRLGALEALARRARLKVASAVVEGRPPAAVVRKAKEAAADLVVVGSHGRPGIARLPAGNVPESIVGKSPRPVLVVRSSRG